MGNIYIGRSEDGKKVIIKTPITDHPDGLGNIRLAKIRRESQILKSLIENAPKDSARARIVKYLDDRDEGDNFYLILEFVEGRSLYELYKGRPAPSEVVSSLTEGLLDIAEFLHSKGVLHRDINPKNLLLEPGGRMVLIDFGMAMMIGEKPTRGGTEGWSAPEQFSDPPSSTQSSDIFGIGNVIFFLLTGLEPAANRDGLGFLKYPRDINPFADRKLSYLASKLALIDPRKRPQSVEEARSLLEERAFVEIDGKKYEVYGKLEVGRAHTCHVRCTRRGFVRLDLPIDDPNSYISEHHVRIYEDDDGRFWLVDLGSLNGTALKHRDGNFIRAQANKPMPLEDGDEVAVVYSEKRGAYKLLRFSMKQS